MPGAGRAVSRRVHTARALEQAPQRVPGAGRAVSFRVQNTQRAPNSSASASAVAQPSTRPAASSAAHVASASPGAATTGRPCRSQSLGLLRGGRALAALAVCMQALRAPKCPTLFFKA